MTKVGIDTISFYTSHYALDLEKLAIARDVDPNKFLVGLGQKEMSIPSPDEDIVTLGANAAAQVLKQVDPQEIDTVLFATESGFDLSKAAGVYIHRLLNLPKHCRVVDLKQACYATTAGLQMACGLVARNPQKKILIVSSDISRYALNTAAESSQGCGAVAMVISADPRLIELEADYGLYTEDVMDFWRQIYCDAALVDGRYSSLVYMTALEQTWQDYHRASQRPYTEIDYHCYHSPVPRLVEKAHKKMMRTHGGRTLNDEEAKAELDNTLNYARHTGNCYSAALYEGFTSLLDNTTENMAGKRVGFYSYGSGCVAEYFTGVIQKGYKKVLNTSAHKKIFKNRRALTVEEYEEFYHYQLPTDGSEFTTPNLTDGQFRFSGMDKHKRQYEAVKKKIVKKRCILNVKEPFVVTTRSPGKIILSGEHSVVYGGPALALAINRYAETTISPQISKMISFNLLNLRLKESFTIQTLRTIKHQLQEKYQGFLHGDLSIREVLQTPFDLLQYTLMSSMDHFNSKIIDGLNITTRSDIPPGCGMGSSAALIVSVLFAISRYCKLNLKKEKFLSLAHDAENLQHGYSSGLDLSASFNGGYIHYQDGHETVLETPSVEMLMVNTGTPEVTTGETVSLVKKKYQDDLIWQDFSSVTQTLDHALRAGDSAEIDRLIQKNHELLTRIGVVPARVQSFISEIEKIGGVAKVCGAGAIAGEKAGIVMVLSKAAMQVKEVCTRFGYSVFPVHSEKEGVKIVA